VTPPSRSTALGQIVSREAAQRVLQVRPDAGEPVVGRALSRLPVEDLNVENPPLEEVMSELFARSRAERERPA
jgi:ABC-2 type transport system ATP-binding protein